MRPKNKSFCITFIICSFLLEVEPSGELGYRTLWGEGHRESEKPRWERVCLVAREMCRCGRGMQKEASEKCLADLSWKVGRDERGGKTERRWRRSVKLMVLGPNRNREVVISD